MSGKVLLIEDDKIQRIMISKILDSFGYSVEVCANGKEALQFLGNSQDQLFDVILLDLYMPEIGGLEVLEVLREQYPEIEVIILSGSISDKDLERAMRLGAIEYVNKPVDPERFNIVVRNVVKISGLKRVVNKLVRKDESTIMFTDIIGHETGLVNDINTARKASLSNVPVLITGEFGVGKETIARAIHGESARSGAAFIVVDCRTIASNMIDSVLFGHTKNALPGIDYSSLGKCSEADKGTLFLRNIESLPIESQMRLLHLIQKKEYTPIGADEPVVVDTRIISSASPHFVNEVKQGNFKEDLYFRLGIANLHILPLRERREDIIPIAFSFIREFAIKENRKLKDISSEAREVLKHMYWSLNIIEVKHLIHRCMMISKNDMIDTYVINKVKEHFEENPITEDRHLNNFYSLSVLDFNNELKSLEEIECEAIKIALRHNLNNVTRTSKALGIAKSTLYKKIHDNNIPLD